jgi:quercetin dioxygenase-like cupin family protein
LPVRVSWIYAKSQYILLEVMAVINEKDVSRQWAARGVSCELWIDPPGQRWEDFVHDTDEFVLVLEGKLELVINGEISHPKTGEEVYIPAGAIHSVRNIGGSTARWLYGYR